MLKELGFVGKEGGGQDWDLTWTDGAVHPELLTAMQPFQKVNHFPGMFNLSRKNYLTRNISRMQRSFPEEYDFYPKTWSLPYEQA